jgi:hypothetical protein
MDAWSAASGFSGALAARAPEWAVATALIVVSLGGVGCLMVGIGLAARKLLGMGATPEQVAGLLDRKINGGIDRLEAGMADLRKQVRELDDKVDQRHAENQLAIGELRGALRIGRRQ